MISCIPTFAQIGLRKCMSTVSYSSRLTRSRHGYALRLAPSSLVPWRFNAKVSFTSISSSSEGTVGDAANSPLLDPLPSPESVTQSLDILPQDTASVGDTTMDILPPDAAISSNVSAMDILPDDGDLNITPAKFDDTFLRRSAAFSPLSSNTSRQPQLPVLPSALDPLPLSSNTSPVSDPDALVPINSSDIVDRLLKRKTNPSLPKNTEKISLTQALTRLSWRENLWKASTSQNKSTLGEQLSHQGEKVIPTSTWVLVENISPISSLQAMLQGIQEALDSEEVKGIIDLNKVWCQGDPLPMMDLSQIPAVTTSNQHKWVRKAKLVLSPFGRPTGWYLQFDNRSIVYALLNHYRESGVRCTWRVVRIREYKKTEKSGENGDPVSHGNLILHEAISDSTLRVENCPYNVTHASLLNFFSRYDLKPDSKSIELWHGVTTDGKICPPTTYLVHFADSSWARAALREKQNTYMYKMGEPVKDFKNPKPLRLVQYPRQML